MKNIWPMACRTRCACEPGAPARSYAGLRLSSRPRARYQSRPGVPPSVARRFAATSPIASTITPARVRLSTAARAAAASMTSVITCCRRLASRDCSRVSSDRGAGSADPVLIVIPSRSPRNHLRGAPRNFGTRRTPAIQVVCACGYKPARKGSTRHHPARGIIQVNAGDSDAGPLGWRGLGAALPSAGHQADASRTSRVSRTRTTLARRSSAASWFPARWCSSACWNSPSRMAYAAPGDRAT